MTATNRDEIANITLDRKLHHRHVKDERRIYHIHRELAQAENSEWLTLIIDGMDQRKTDCPNAGGKRDRDDDGLTVATRIIGVKAHGHGQFFYIVPPDVPHTGDVTWSIIMDVINRIREASDRQLPGKLWVQMDNTTSDNKTKVNLAMLRSVVESGCFREAHMGFLPKGHTHEDIDQAFSVIAQYLTKNVCHTFEQLAEACRSAFTGVTTHAEVLSPKKLRACQRWLDHKFDRDWMHMTEMHQFCFRADKVDNAGRPYLFYKEWMRQEDFIKLEQEPVKLNRQAKIFQVTMYPWDINHVEKVRDTFLAAHDLNSETGADGGALAAAQDSKLVLRNLNVQKLKTVFNAGQWWLQKVREIKEQQEQRCVVCLTNQQARKSHPSTGSPEVRRNNARVRKQLQQDLTQHKAEDECPEDVPIVITEWNWIEKQLLRLHLHRPLARAPGAEGEGDSKLGAQLVAMFVVVVLWICYRYVVEVVF